MAAPAAQPAPPLLDIRRARRASAEEAAASTGTPCRVCEVDDREERVQPDLHRGCLELATNRARKRQARQRRPRPLPAPAPAATPSRADLIAQRARELAAGGAPPPARRARLHRVELEHGQGDDDEAPALTADESAAVDALTRGGGLATGGLGAEVDDA